MNRHDEQHDDAHGAEGLPSELTELDAALRDALAATPVPRELVERIEVALGVYDPSLERSLRRELGVDLPDEVADDIAGAVGLADVQLDAELRTALAAPSAPHGMTDRIHAACGLATDAQSAAVIPPVLARIGSARAWRIAIAAALVAALSLGVYLATLPPDTPNPPKNPGAMGTMTAAELDALEQGIAAALDSDAPVAALDDEIDDLTAEVDALTVTLAFGSNEDPLDAYADQLDRELDLIENHLGSF